MVNNPADNLASATGFCKQAEDSSTSLRGLYDALCQLDTLRLAYTQIKGDPQNYGVDTTTLETVEEKDIESFLQQLSNDLQARTYRPAPAPQPSTTSVSERGGAVGLRDLVVQAALKRLLEPAFPPAFPSDPQPEKTIKWLAGNIEKGFSRVYAVNVEQCLAVEQHERLLATVRQRVEEPDLIHLLASILAALAQPGHSQPEPLAPLLADIALESLDPILQQTKAFGREENFLHVHCTRVANQVVILLDQDSRYDWILAAVRKRLREELANLHYDLAAVETQSVDLTRGGSLHFLDFELRLVKGRHGEPRVHYRLLDETQRRRAGRTSPRRRYHPLRFLRPYVSWLGRQRVCQVVYRACRKAQAIQVGWRHLPITLFPVLLLFFGWRSPAAWLCLALIFVCNWRWTLATVRTENRRGWRLAQHACRKAHTVQVGWRHLPITLFPVLLLFFGWRSLVPWLCLAAIFLCNWRWTLSIMRWAGRHKLDVVVGACAVAALAFLYPFVSDIYANRPREVAASSSLPPGFYRGEYHGDSWWQGEPTPAVHYGLYLPPHLQGKKGPFPLIVFLHGYGERTKTRIFKAGLPAAIANRFGTNKPNGHFEFVAFFPIDRTGRWQAGTAEVEGVMMALDYVIRRHRIDPARVYLTGVSAGGSGVWSLAEAYPDKWAAVAPLCSFDSPDVAKVRHIPAWIFHGAKDQLAPVERERILVQQLKEANADVRYTEFPNKGHGIWPEAYNPKALYKWLASKKKG